MAPQSAYFEVCRDPIGAPAAGIADEFSNPTAAIKLRSTHQLTVNSAGNGALAFIGNNIDTSFVSNATVTAGTSTITAWTGTAHPDYTTLDTSYYLWRAVSMAIRIFPINAEASLAGTITAGSLDGVNSPLDITTTMPADTLDLTEMPGSKTVSVATMTDSLVAVCHNFDRPPFMGLSGAGNNLCFPTLFVAVNGAQASTNVLRVECFLNVELIAKWNTLASLNHSRVYQHSAFAMSSVARRLATSRVGSEAQVTALIDSSESTYKKKKKSPYGRSTKYGRSGPFSRRGMYAKR